jgi:hypothetical protein
MFVPTQREEDRVQWHLIESKNPGARLSYRAVSDQCPTRCGIADLSLEDLLTTRAFVGWCSSVFSTLGSANAEYERIEYSRAPEVGKSLKLSGVSLGVQHFGLAQVNFTLGAKDSVCHFPRSGSYEYIISAAGKTRIVLYDTEEGERGLYPPRKRYFILCNIETG